MQSSAVQNAFRHALPHAPERALTSLVGNMGRTAPAGDAATIGARMRTVWPADRLALTNQLWGPGFIFPGGETETLRLSRRLDVSANASLLIVGVGSGGPASAVSRNLGAWVTGMDQDPSLLAAAQGLISRSRLTKKVGIKAWSPSKPGFEVQSHHHCLALEPLHGARPEPILYGLACALKTGGHIVITELTAAAPLDPDDPIVRRWAELEHRDPANLLAPVAVTRMLGRVGLDVRDVEDISQRHLEQAMLGWRVLLRGMDRKPDRQEAVYLLHEAELWLLRRRLIRDGRLQMMCWHAISRGLSLVQGLPSTNGFSTA